MRLKILALAAAVLLVAGLAAVAAAVHFFDPRSLALSLAASVKADTGRELRFGAVEVTFLPRPALLLQEVRFGNTAWGSRPWLAQAGRASADIDVLALLSRELRIKHIEVSDASVLLETDSAGRGNWIIDLPDTGAPSWFRSLQIEQLELQSIALGYRDGATGKTASVQLERASFEFDETIHLDVRATLAGKRMEAAGTVGTLASLLADVPAYPVDLEGKVGAAGVSLRGNIANPRTLGGLKLALSVKTEELGELAALWGASARPLGPLIAAAQLTGTAASPAFSGIDAVLGGRERPEIRLRGAVADIRAASGIDLTLAAAATKPWRFGNAASGPLLPSYRASARLRDAPQGYRVDEIELSIAVDGTSKTSLQVVQGGQLAIKDGRLNTSALQVTLGGAKVTLDGSIADPGNLAGLDLGIALQGGELAELFKFFGAPIREVGAFQGRARMQGSVDALRLAAIDIQAGRSGQSLHVTGEIDNVIERRGIQLAMTANVSDSTAAGVLFGVELPRLPSLRATARVADAPGGYAFEDLKLALGRTSMQGRVTHARGEPRPRVTAELSGPLLDLSEFPPPQGKRGESNPLLVADVDANIRFDRVVLPGRRALGPVSGGVRLAAGAVELKQFTVAVEGASATLEGRIGEPLARASIDLMVNAKITHAAGLEAITGQRLPIVPAFTASGRLTDVSDGYALAGLQFAHAATTITGDIAVTRGAKRFRVSAKGRSPLLDVSALLQSAEGENAAKSKAAAERGAAKPKAVGARAIPDVPLALNVLRLIDADLDLRFDAVKISEAPLLGPLIAHAVISEGSLKAEPVHLVVKTDQALDASATIDDAKSAWAVRIDSKGIDFGELLARLGRAGAVTGGSTDLRVQLQGRGKSLTALLGSLNGAVHLAVGPHRVHNVAVNLKGGLFLNLFALANPFQKTDPDTDVKCLAVSVPVRNGILTSERNIALETAKYNVIATGTVNLRTERIDIAVTPVVRSEAGTIVRVGGTLADPSVGLDVAGAARSAASLGVAVVAPAWLIADSWLKKAASDPNPCATAVAAAVPPR